MPPETYLGLLFIKKLFTACPSSRSSSLWERPTRLVYPFCCKLFHSRPTSPWWPATYIFVFHYSLFERTKYSFYTNFAIVLPWFSQFRNRRSLIPAMQVLAGGITQQLTPLSRDENTEDRHGSQFLAVATSTTSLPLHRAFPAQFSTHFLEAKVQNSRTRMVLAGRNDKIFGSIMLKNHPHALHIIFGAAPVRKWIPDFKSRSGYALGYNVQQLK